MNKAILIGHLGMDPELKYTDGGQAVMRLRLATSERWKDKSGQRQERTEWHTVVMWGGRAEAIAKHLSKGQQIAIEGRIQTRQWEDRGGGKRYSTEIVASELHFLGGGQRNDGKREAGGYGQSQRDDFPPDGGGFDDDEIPF